jgi:hypothetical protein
MTAGGTIDDPDSSIDLVGWHTFTVDETESIGTERQYSGWITGRRLRRGPYKDGLGRIVEFDIIDLNEAWHLEVFRAASAHRPAETDIERMEWCLASAPMTGTPVADNGRFNHTDGPTAFGEADYVKQYPVEVGRSVAGTSGKNGYSYWDHTNAEISIHYDLLANAPACDMRISNDMADTDADTLYPFRDAVLSTDPQRINTGILFGYRGGYAYDRRQATIDALSPTEFSPDEFRRDFVYDSDRVGLAATAEALIDAMLETMAVEEDKITVSVRVAAADVGRIEAGMAIDVKFTHLGPDYVDFVSVPIIRHNKVPTPGRTDMWDIHLELSPALLSARGPGGGSGGDFPHQPPAEHWWAFSGNDEGDGGETEGSPDCPQVFVPGTYNYYVHVKNNLTYAAHWEIKNNAGTQTWLESTNSTGSNVGEFTWTGTFTIPVSGDPVSTTGPVTATGNGHDFSVAAGGFTEIMTFWMACAASGHVAGRFADFDGYFDLVTSGDDAPPGPDAGEMVGPEVPSPTPDGDTLVFTTAYPYADLSLRVFVDNLNQTAAVTESDPETGEFTLAFAPRADETLLVWYQRR